MRLTIASHETGYVVVTDNAILSIISKSQLEAGSGVVGGVVASAIGRSMEKKKAEAAPAKPLPANLAELQRVETCKVADLPRAVVSAAGFPKVEGFRSVTIYPKRAIQAAKASIWKGLVLTMGGVPHSIAVQMWQIGKLKRHLSEAGYRMG
jgi:hypothetical protein